MGFWMLWGTYLWYVLLGFSAILGLLLVWGVLFKLLSVLLEEEEMAAVVSLLLILVFLFTGIAAHTNSTKPKPPAEAAEQTSR